ncbi:kinase-like domain-containing protein [Circinella umbellata]|nr:kinase-like domain-containing protein [Circinella umbellata]
MPYSTTLNPPPEPWLIDPFLNHTYSSEKMIPSGEEQHPDDCPVLSGSTVSTGESISPESGIFTDMSLAPSQQQQKKRLYDNNTSASSNNTSTKIVVDNSNITTRPTITTTPTEGNTNSTLTSPVSPINSRQSSTEGNIFSRLFRRSSSTSNTLNTTAQTPTPGTNKPVGTPHIGRLSEKYGEYVKPERSHKGMGATSRKNIASGATAVIRLIRSLDRKNILAVKEFKKPDRDETERDYLKRMHNEYCISKSVSNHTNVVKTLDLVLDEQDHWCTIMEYCAGGDLFTLLGERPMMPSMEQACLFKQLILGLQHLHSTGIAHRDIKPENLILTTGGTLKIADFGVASVVKAPFQREAQRCKHWCGSSQFWSPEIWTLKDDNDSYDGQALDIWSAAVTYYCMRFGYLPFTSAFYNGVGHFPPPPGAKPGSPSAVAAAAEDGGDPEYGIYCNQREELGPIKCELWDGGSEQYLQANNKHKVSLAEQERECLAGMLDVNPVTRWTVDQILACEWVSNRIEMCEDGALPNGWRHYHCIPTPVIR